MAPVIECEALTKCFRSLRAVDGLTFAVEPGSVVGFLGPNGAGKSTTIRLLLGFLRPSSGTSQLLGGRPLTEKSLLGRVGYLPGDFQMEPRMTGRELFRWFGRLRGRFDERRVDSLVERLDAQPDKPFGTLSKGNRQKIGIIQAFQHRPDVLLLDEPSTGLDPLVQQQFLRLLREAAEDGAAVLFSSHVLPEVERAVDRLIIIRAGRIVDQAAVEDLLLRARQRLDLRYRGPVPADVVGALPGVVHAAVHGCEATITVDGPVGPALRAAADLGDLQRIRTAGDELEELFLSYYADRPAHSVVAEVAP